MSDTEYRNVGSHPQDLHDGRVLARGATVVLNETEVRRNKDLIDDGVLQEIVNDPEPINSGRAGSKQGEGGS